MTMNFGEILTRAWQIIWKHKVLWIFGILASCVSGNGSGGGNSNFNADADSFQSSNRDVPPFLRDFFNAIERFFADSTPEQWIGIAIGLFCLIMIISLISYVLGIMGEIGLYRGVMMVEGGAEKLTFAELWTASTPFFWRLFLLRTVPSLVFLALLAIFLVPAIFLAESTEGVSFLLILLPVFCIILPLSFVVALAIWLGTLTVVMEDLSLPDALKRGWQLLRENFVNMLILGVMLFAVNLIVGLVIALPMILIFLPVIFGIAVGGEIMQATMLTALVCFCLLLPVLTVLGGILQSFNYTSWGLAYLRFTGLVPPAPAPALTEPEHA